MIWRDSVGVGVLGQSLNQCAGYFTAALLCCYAILMTYNNNGTAAYGYNPTLCRVDVLQS